MSVLYFFDHILKIGTVFLLFEFSSCLNSASSFAFGFPELSGVSLCQDDDSSGVT